MGGGGMAGGSGGKYSCDSPSAIFAPSVLGAD